MMDYILTFKNTNVAIKSEQYLLAEKLHVTVMPLPPQIRAGCGISLRLTREWIEAAVRILTEKKFDGIDLYTRTGTERHYIYSEVLDWSAL